MHGPEHRFVPLVAPVRVFALSSTGMGKCIHLFAFSAVVVREL